MFNNIPYVLLVSFVSYIIGAIPTAFIMCKILANVDIREEGSGNVGANNTRRVIGNIPAIFVLIIDILKGVLPVLGALYIQEKFAIYSDLSVLPVFAAFFAVLGHCKSIFIGLSGGKGAATGFGTLIALYWPIAIIVAVLSIISAKITKFQSMGVLLIVPFAGILMLFLNQPLSYSIYCMIVSVFMIYLFRSNIKDFVEKLDTKHS